MEYKIILEKNDTLTMCIANIEKEVNKLLVEGWRPIGGIATMQANTLYHSYTACQSMVKE